MVTRFGVRTNRATERLNLHVSLVSPLPTSYRDAFNDPNWKKAITSSDSLLQQIIRSLHQDFAMTDLGSLNYFLDISVTRDSSRLFLSQKKYAIQIIDRVHMDNCNPSQTPIDTESKLRSDGDPVSDLTLYRSLAGSLQYLTFTPSNISYVVHQIMPPKIMTRSASRETAAPRGGRMGGRTGRGGGKTGGRSGDQGDGRIDGQDGQVAQVDDQGRGQGNGRNQNGNAVNDNIQGDVRNVIENNGRKGCTYKEFLACKPKEYDGKGGSYVVELLNPHTRNRFIKKNPEQRGNGGEPSKDKNVRDENKRTRTSNAFAITTNPVKREHGYGHFAKDCRVVPRNVNPINARNPTARAYYECGSTDHIKSACPRNQARGRAFILGAEEARHDPNIMTGIEPSDLGFSYEIEIASRKLVEIDKVINVPLCGRKL
uniref:Ribonuclease H-like domain-containing protein n=1 Tax=Tanacetum cinerariifolium TaxID=118510 RepID=A0A6L2NSU1_TANCI|nr:ribonuclease H-like domain-containing protein [Tanacetum cinerariifolium]